MIYATLEIFLGFWRQLSNFEETTGFGAKDTGLIPAFATFNRYNFQQFVWLL